jgi:hypothetical protein
VGKYENFNFAVQNQSSQLASFYPEFETPCQRRIYLKLIGRTPVNRPTFSPALQGKQDLQSQCDCLCHTPYFPALQLGRLELPNFRCNFKFETALCQLSFINKERRSLIGCRKCTFHLIHVNWIECRNVQFTLSSLEDVSEDLLADHGRLYQLL